MKTSPKYNQLLTWYRKRTRLSLSLLSIVLYIGYYVPYFWPLIILALVPFLSTLTSTTDLKKRLSFIFFFIFPFSLLYSSFHIGAAPLSWAGIDSFVLSTLVIAPLWIVTALTCVLGYVPLLLARMKSPSDYALTASLWVASEIFRAFLLSVLLKSPETTFGIHWTFGDLGYALVHLQLVNTLASVGGIYLLSSLLVFVSLFVIDLTKTRQFSNFFKIGFTVFVLLVIAGEAHRATIKPVGTHKVAAVSTMFPVGSEYGQQSRLERSKTLNNLVRNTSREKPNIIILPEGSNYLSGIGNINLARQSLKEPTHLIDSGLYRGARAQPLSAPVVNADGAITASYQKEFLIPYGEYLPSFVKTLSDFASADFRQKVADTYVIQSQENAVSNLIVGGVSYGYRFCGEAIPTHLYQNSTRDGAQVLVNSSSLRFFTSNENMQRQLLTMIKARAVENGRTMIVSGNEYGSYIINRQGQITSSLKNQNSALVGEISLYNGTTPYTQTPYILPIVMLFYISVYVMRKKKLFHILLSQ